MSGNPTYQELARCGDFGWWVNPATAVKIGPIFRELLTCAVDLVKRFGIKRLIVQHCVYGLQQDLTSLALLDICLHAHPLRLFNELIGVVHGEHDYRRVGLLIM